MNDVPHPKEIQESRKPAYPIQSLILSRWSPRSMKGEGISDEELFPLFEAARWAPSSYNSQPWRFLYAKRETPEWDLFFDLMVEGNQAWTKDAAVLLVIVSRDTLERNNKPAVTHSYDTGAAWMAMALEGSARGLVVHGISGFDFKKAKEVLNVPDGYTLEAMAAIGKRGPKDNLPEQLAKIEAPSDRKPIEEFVFCGKFRQ